MTKKPSYNYKFIDLFAGLGGFHMALSKIGCKCVFSSEIKEDLRKFYAINFPGTRIEGDITKIPPENIPAHDMLCAGFPCQPFSQAGNRQGFNDEKGRGTLFDYIIGIIAFHKPRYVILENVSNLKGHDKGNTWKVIQAKLDEQGYWVKADILSPHEFGIPQHRRRIYIVCLRKDCGTLDGFEFPQGNNVTCNINDIIDVTATERLSEKKPIINWMYGKSLLTILLQTETLSRLSLSGRWSLERHMILRLLHRHIKGSRTLWGKKAS